MGKKPRKTHRLAIMSATGGGAATVADRLGTLGIDVVGPTQQVIDNLAGNSAIRAWPFLQSSPICEHGKREPDDPFLQRVDAQRLGFVAARNLSKKTQETPTVDLRLARNRVKEVKRES